MTEGNYEITSTLPSFNNNYKIAQNAQCLICFDKLPDAVLMDCGHGGYLQFILNLEIGVCRECAEDIWKKSGECYLCRQKITSMLILDLTSGIGNYKPIVKTVTQKIEDGSFIDENYINQEEYA